MSTLFTDLIDEFSFLSDIRDEEKFESKRYQQGKEPHRTIGYGHYIASEEAYTKLASAFGFEDKENLTKEEASKLLYYDASIRRHEMARAYPDVPNELRNIMLNVRFQFSPQMFDKHFGSALRTNDTAALKTELTRLGNVRKKKGEGGMLKRWNRVAVNLDEYQNALNEGKQ